MTKIKISELLEPIRNLNLEAYLINQNKLFKWPKEKYNFEQTLHKQLKGIKKGIGIYHYQIWNAYFFYMMIIILSALIIAVIVTSIANQKIASYHLAYAIIFFLSLLFLNLVIYIIIWFTTKKQLKFSKTVNELLVLSQWFLPKKVLSFPYAIAIIFAQAYIDENNKDFNRNDIKILEKDVVLNRWYKSRQRDLLLHLQRLYFLYVCVKYLVNKGYKSNKEIKFI